MPKSDEFERGTGGGTKISGFGPPPDHRYCWGLNSGNLFLFVFGWGSLKTHFFHFSKRTFFGKVSARFSLSFSLGRPSGASMKLRKKIKKTQVSARYSLSFKADPPKSIKKQSKITKKSRCQTIRFGACFVHGVHCLLASGGPPGASIKLRKKHQKNISFGTVFIVF